MTFLFFWLIPLYAGFAGRKRNLADAFYSFLGVFFAAYCGVLSAAAAGALLNSLIPLNGFERAGALLAVCGMVFALIWKVVEGALPNRSFRFEFPEKAEMILAPIFAFLKAGIVISLLFAFIAISPLSGYVKGIAGNRDMCQAARLRLRQVVWTVDFLSGQPSKFRTSRSRVLQELLPLPLTEEEIRAQEEARQQAALEKAQKAKAEREKIRAAEAEKKRQVPEAKKNKKKSMVVVYDDEPAPPPKKDGPNQP